MFSTKETLDGRFGDDTAQETGTHHVLSSSCSQVPGDIRFVPPAQGLRLRSGMIPDEQPAIEDVFCVAGTDVVNVLPPLFFLRHPKKGEPTGRANRNTRQSRRRLDGDFPGLLRQGDYAGLDSGGSLCRVRWMEGAAVHLDGLQDLERDSRGFRW